jgi:diguanylate cyclase (GGDEF)-like protein
MKIGETRPSGAIGSSRREREATARYARSQSLGTAQPVDSASVMGIPETELTPKVRAAIMTLMQEVDHLRGELERSQTRLAHLERLADQDTLIPVPNRRAFVRELGRVISYSQRYETPASLIYFDVNDFKNVNDQFGHAAGDAALIHVARTLMDHLRESDLVGRLGGDEFGVILANTDESRAKEKAAELAEQTASNPVIYDGNSFTITLSYGTTTFEPGVSATDAMAAADKAMYAHKAEKKRGP